MSSAKIPDEPSNSAEASSHESSPTAEALDTTAVTDEARANATASAENELDPTSLDEELLRYLFTIC